MIQFPKRSVTRFLIPLIDVTTLLFCIFLLMPMVKPSAETTGLAALADLEEQIRLEQERLQKLQDQGQAPTAEQLEALRKLEEMKKKTLQDRLVVRVLEIDPDTGKLYYYPTPADRLEVRNAEDARELIDKDRRAQAGDRRELYYLILFPRTGPGTVPTRKQRVDYREWFKDVALGWDIPGVGTVPGGMP
jgi:hypothetical protein